MSRDLLFAPILPFVSHPDRALLVAGILLLLFGGLLATRRFFAWPILGAAIVWMGYAFGNGWSETRTSASISF
jgi:hypothetical protein